MNLEEVAGIVISEDGVAHPFGESDEKVGADNVLSHEEYFYREIASQRWFKDLQIDYEPKNLYYAISDMTKKGLSFIINGSSVKHTSEDIYTFAIFVPSNMTDAVKNYFSSNYRYLKDLIERTNAFFQADSISDGEYKDASPISSIDEFYEAMDITKQFKK